MSDNKHPDSDPEKTLITLDQLSQTIEVMTSVVNRLRQHLSEQLKAQIEGRQPPANEVAERVAKERDAPVNNTRQAHQKNQENESFVIEIRQQETEPVRKNTKTLH